MSEAILGCEIPPDVRLHLLEGKSFEEMALDLPNRPKTDVEFGILVLSRHPLFEMLSAMMTRSALKHPNAKSILDKMGYAETQDVEAQIDPKALSFLKECHALCVEFHVRAVKEYQEKQNVPGRN